MKPSLLGATGVAGQQLDKDLPGLEVLGIPPTSAKVSEVCTQGVPVQSEHAMHVHGAHRHSAECASAVKPSLLSAPGVSGQQVDKELPGLEVLGIPPTSAKAC